MKKSYESATDAAVAYVSHRERTEGEVRDKLAEYGFTDEQADEAIRQLKESLLINDDEYAREYVRSYLATPHSVRALRMKLKGHKLPDAIIEAVTQDLDTDFDNAYAESFSFLHNAMRGDTDVRKLREKLYRRLVSHGYSYDTAKEAAGAAFSELRAESEE